MKKQSVFISKARAESSSSVTIKTVTPTGMVDFDQLDGDELLLRVARVGKMCAINLIEDSKYISNICNKLDKDSLWLKISPTWDEFCQMAFGCPATHIDLIRVLGELSKKGDLIKSEEVSDLVSKLQVIVKERG